MRPSRLAFACCLALLLPAGCAEPPQDLFTVSQTQLAQRQVESRRYEGIGETELLAACAGVLQDLGFNLDDSETALGVITASKRREAGALGALGGLLPQIAFSIFSGHVGSSVQVPVEREQNIRVSLVVSPTQGERAHIVRATFQRVVSRSDGTTRSETLRDPILYRDFHDRLSKSVFIEAQQL